MPSNPTNNFLSSSSLETLEICGKKMKKMRQGLRKMQISAINVANSDKKCGMYNTSVQAIGKHNTHYF